jgi:hypothetical protein
MSKAFFLLSLLLLALWGCGSPVQTPQTPQSASISISPSSAIVVVLTSP